MAAAKRTEGARILGLALLIVVTIGAYVAVRSMTGRNGPPRLMPYQTLAAGLAEREQQMFDAVHRTLLRAEDRRARTGRWPEPDDLAEADGAFTAARGYRWRRTQASVVTQYLGLPGTPSDPAWLLAIQEPVPGAPPDPAPNDEEHHRLPNGTVLHLYVWMHRVGGRMPSDFIPSPESSGWMQVLHAPPNPTILPRS